eukprot:10550380-Alexandrium_andersonii.AAC.1
MKAGAAGERAGAREAEPSLASADMTGGARGVPSPADPGSCRGAGPAAWASPRRGASSSCWEQSRRS